jgi:hypothetical protein
MKPGAAVSLEGHDLKKLFEILHQRHLYSKYDGLSAFCRKLEASRIDLKMRNGKIVHVVKQASRVRRAEPEAMEQPLNNINSSIIDNAVTAPVDHTYTPDEGKRQLENRLLSITHPMPIATPVLEPYGVFLNYTKSPVTKAGKDEMADFNAVAQNACDAARERGFVWPGIDIFMKSFGEDGVYMSDVALKAEAGQRGLTVHNSMITLPTIEHDEDGIVIEEDTSYPHEKAYLANFGEPPARQSLPIVIKKVKNRFLGKVGLRALGKAYWKAHAEHRPNASLFELSHEMQEAWNATGII